MPPPTLEKLLFLKTIKLPGTLPLTHKPVLPSLVLFQNRPKEFLNVLRTFRENIPSKKFRSSKKQTREITEAVSTETGKNFQCSSSNESSTKRAKRTNKKSKTLSPESLKNLTESQKLSLLKALGL